ncbi:MAG: hypothetical protein M1819_001768 [Sarea resinae]|nr:MAG: hypothetical protein M1819_001768 [Sarea resinae]
MHDPSLTPFGEEQCRQLRDRFPYHHNVDLLVCSPIRRTIYTTLLGFEPELKRGIKVIALPEAQETSDLPCDTGSDRSVLAAEMKDKPVDLSLVQEGWNSKQGKWAPDSETVRARAKAARNWLKARPEKEIVLVTHGGFLHFFTEDWTDSNKYEGTGWTNTEFRSYRFTAGDSDDANASLIETPESRELRRGTEHPLGEAEKTQLKLTREKSKEKAERQQNTYPNPKAKV